MCLYIHIYLHLYIHVYIYIHIHIYRYILIHVFLDRDMSIYVCFFLGICFGYTFCPTFWVNKLSKDNLPVKEPSSHGFL